MKFKIPDTALAAEAKSVLADPVEGELVPFDVARYISSPVKAARIKAELSQEDLAMRMGVSQAYVSKMEKARKVSPKVLHQVGMALAKPKRARRVLKKPGQPDSGSATCRRLLTRPTGRGYDPTQLTAGQLISVR